MSEKEREERKQELMTWGKPNLCIYIINLERRLDSIKDMMGEEK